MVPSTVKVAVSMKYDMFYVSGSFRGRLLFCFTILIYGPRCHLSNVVGISNLFVCGLVGILRLSRGDNCYNAVTVTNVVTSE